MFPQRHFSILPNWCGSFLLLIGTAVTGLLLSACGGDKVNSIIPVPELPPALQPSPSGKLNDTGITLCGDYISTHLSDKHSNDVACTLFVDADGDPVPPGQDGHLGRDVTFNDDSNGHAGFDFTKIGADGDALAIQDRVWNNTGSEAEGTRWSCVKDNVTGLIWEVKSAKPNGVVGDAGLHDSDDTYVWYEPNMQKNGGISGFQRPSDKGVKLDGTLPENRVCYGYADGDVNTWCNTYAYVNRVNKAGLCRARNWRMPTVAELDSISDYLHDEPSIDTAYFPNTVPAWYWSSTPYAANANNAWFSHFGYGGNSGFWSDHGHNFSVRLVRSDR